MLTVRRRSAPRLMLGLLLSVPCLSALAAEPLGGIKLTSCNLPDLPQPARCGVLNVPESPEKKGGRQLAIHVAVVPATGGSVQPDPIVLLMGGPGEEAISSASLWAELFAALRIDRDILLIDTRGTGRSATLRCDLYSADEPQASLRDFLPPAAVKRCVQQVSKHADLTQYGYTRIVDDIEHVRRALGYGPVNLSAGSYGTRAAQVYMRTYPQSVRTAYLGSVVPIDVTMPLPFSKTAQTEIDKTIDACAAEPACRAAFPKLREEFREVLARLDAGSVRVSVPGREDTALLYRGRFVEWLRGKVYRPFSAADLPWVIHQAYRGNWQPAVDGILAQAKGADTALSFGQFFTITCNEDVAFLREADIVREAKGTYLGDYRARQQQTACKEWPKALVSAVYREAVRSSIPTLFASGDSDGGISVRYTEQAAKGFSNSAQIVMRGQGHTEWNACVGRLYEEFVRSGSVKGLAVSSCPSVPRPSFKTE